VNTPKNLRYGKTHEWVRPEGQIAVVGITDYAQESLGDIVDLYALAGLMDVSPALKDAVKDYFFLQNKAYPEKASVALVGDRYRLSKEERMVLFRGITSYQQA